MKLSLRRRDITTPIEIPGLDIDWDTNNQFYKTISSNATFSFSNTMDGQTIIVRLTNSSGSNLTVTWPSSTVGASTSITASKTKIFTFIRMGSSIYSSSTEY